jgi:hypothetical protein
MGTVSSTQNQGPAPRDETAPMIISANDSINRVPVDRRVSVAIVPAPVPIPTQTPQTPQTLGNEHIPTRHEVCSVRILPRPSRGALGNR